jgi:hypothetical protein
MSKVNGIKILLAYDESTGITVEKTYNAWFDSKGSLERIDSYLKDIKSILRNQLKKYMSHTTIDFMLLTENYERKDHYRITFGYDDNDRRVIEHRPYNENDYSAPYKVQFVDGDFKDSNGLLKKVIKELSELIEEQKNIYDSELVSGD